MKFILVPISLVEELQSQTNKLLKLVADNQEKRQVCLKKNFRVRNLLVSSISRTDCEQLKQELHEILEIIDEISREI